MVDRRPHKPEAVGSIPTSATNFAVLVHRCAAAFQAVLSGFESHRSLQTAGDVGSIPTLKKARDSIVVNAPALNLPCWMELADTLRLERSAARRGGSSPSQGTRCASVAQR